LRERERKRERTREKERERERARDSKALTNENESENKTKQNSSAAAGLRATGRALFPPAESSIPSSISAAAALLSSTTRTASSPPKTGERAPPESRITPDPEDEWRKERRIGRGVGDEPPRGKGSRLGPYHLGTAEEEEEEEEDDREPVTADQKQQQQTPTLGGLRLGRRLRSLSLSSPSSPHGEVPALGADPATLDDAKGSSAPGTPYGMKGHSDRPDLDFLGEGGGRGGGEGGGEGEGGEAPLRASLSSSSSSSSSSQQETIWDRLRGPGASEANAAAAEAVAEGRVPAGAREREEAEVSPKLGGGTGKAL
jgi:hypothetical protein